MTTDKNFPRGLDNWLETYYEVASFITIQMAQLPSHIPPKLYKVQLAEGRGGLYTLTEALTDEIEKRDDADIPDDMDFYEFVENFLKSKLLDVVYTSEAGQNFTREDIVRFAKGNEQYADMLLSRLGGQHPTTLIEEDLMEGEIVERVTYVLTPQIDEEEEESRYKNYYRCPSCGKKWSEQWSSGCDSECPSCDMNNISPYKSEEIE